MRLEINKWKHKSREQDDDIRDAGQREDNLIQSNEKLLRTLEESKLSEEREINARI